MRFDRLRTGYGRMLDVALRNRGCVYAVWVVVGVLGMLMITMAPKELAPTEDQGVIFGMADASANATIDQTGPLPPRSTRVLQRAGDRIRLPAHPPSGGFGGMVVKPWDERKRNNFQIMPEVQRKLQAIPASRFAGPPPALPGGGIFPSSSSSPRRADL